MPHPDDKLERARRAADLAEARNRLEIARAQARMLRRLRDVAGGAESTAGRGRRGTSDGRGENWALSGSYRSSRNDRTRRQLGGPAGSGGGRVPLASPDTHLDDITLEAIRRDAQDLHRNSELARALVTRLADLTVGDGSTVIPKTSSDAFNARVAELWASYWNHIGVDPATGVHGVDARATCAGPEWERLVTQQVAVDGDLLVPVLDDGSAQVIDGARVVSEQGPRNAPAKDWTDAQGGESGGVILDRRGRPQGFRVADYHPAGGGVAKPARVVPASSALWLVNPRGRAMGVNQTRGEPLLAPVFQRIVQLDGFIDAAQVAARINACMTGFIKSKDPAGMQASLPGQTVTATNADGTSRSDREMSLQPGMIWHLDPGEDVGSIAPNQPTASFESFVRSSMELICAHVGVPLLMAFFDPSGINLSTMRGMVITAGVGFRAWQEWRVRCLLAPLYRWRVAAWIREGKLPAPPADWARHEWITEPVPVLDPEGETRTWALAIEKGLGTRDMACRSMYGKPGRDMVAELADEQKYEREVGLVLMTTPGQQVKDAADNGAGPRTPSDPANPDQR